MREVFEEYGKITTGAAVSVLLIGLTVSFLSNGQIFQVIQAFSQSIC